MDRMTKAVHQLWGPLQADGRLHKEPVFADELASKCDGQLALRELKISKWSHGQQLEHLYLSTHYVLDRIEESMTGANASNRMGFWGYGLLVGGFIPRYVFPTIPPLVPASGTLDHIQPLQDRLRSRLEQIVWDLEEIQASPGKSRHPRMKYLTASEWLYFGEIHHRHHLSLIRDIHKVASRAGSQQHAKLA
jgi:hypothetical protein